MPSVLDRLLEGAFDGEDPNSPRQVQIFDGQPTEDELVLDALQSLSDVPPQSGHPLVVATRDIHFVEKVSKGEVVHWDGCQTVIVKGVSYVCKFVNRHIWEAMEAEARRYTESKPERERLVNLLSAFIAKPVRTGWERILKDDE